MKKLALTCGIVCLLASVPANAQLSINFGLEPEYVPAEPVYVQQPAPEYVVAPSYPAYYEHRHYYHPHHDEGFRDHGEGRGHGYGHENEHGEYHDHH